MMRYSCCRSLAEFTISEHCTAIVTLPLSMRRRVMPLTLMTLIILLLPRRCEQDAIFR